MNNIRIAPMTEADIRDVMPLEISSFPDPWSPLAFVEDLRLNPCARYFVAKDEADAVCGYIGYWITPDKVDILKIAVASECRKVGVGKALVQFARRNESSKGCLRVFVRTKNYGAQAFYKALGFQDAGIAKNYYTYPQDDALIMMSAD